MSDMLLWDQTLFRNPQYFELDYVPEFFLSRDSQMQALKFSVAPSLRGARPLNCLCTGPPGTGKTTAVHKLFEELNKHTSEIVTVHINCQFNPSRYTIFAEIYRKLTKHRPPSSGVSFKRIFDHVVDNLLETGKTLIVALDDMNYLFNEGEVNHVLYSLLRAHETNPGLMLSVIGILSDTGASTSYRLDPKAYSVFLPEEIEFPRYSYNEIRDILATRVERGFYPKVASDDIIDVIAAHTHEMKDLRVGIDLLKRAGLNAERRSSKTIEEEDVDKAYEKSKLLHLARLLSNIKGSERDLLKTIAQQGVEAGGKEISSGELYKVFSAATNLGYTRYYELLNKLEIAQLVRMNFSGPGQRGRTRRITLSYDGDEILKQI